MDLYDNVDDEEDKLYQSIRQQITVLFWMRYMNQKGVVIEI